MLLAYLDEIGQTGAFVHPSDKKYSDSPAFGYGGFIIPDKKAREFGAIFAKQKRVLFANEISNDIDPGRWEKKGASLLYAKVLNERPENLRVFGSLIEALLKFGGKLFYYAEEKPIGTPKQTNCGKQEFWERELSAIRETLNRLARYADKENDSILVLMDQINEKSRKQRLPEMYAHILGRAGEYEEMRRVIEPPMHVDSELSSGIQFADWVCALVKRAIEYQLVEDSKYVWIPDNRYIQANQKAFTYESKLHLFKRQTDDIHHSTILHKERPVIEEIKKSTLSDKNLQKLKQVRLSLQTR